MIERRHANIIVLIGAASIVGLAALGYAMIVSHRIVPSAGSGPTPARTAEELMDAAALRSSDLPPGWLSYPPRPDPLSAITGVPGREFAFYLRRAGDLPVTVGEDLFVFDPRPAHDGYLKLVASLFPVAYADEWKATPELEFPSRADEHKTACLSMTVNGLPFQACRMVARYGALVVVVMGNVFGGDALTMAEFRTVLQAADQRIVAALGESQQGTNPGHLVPAVTIR